MDGRGGASAAAIVPGGLRGRQSVLRPAGNLEAREQSGRDTQTKRPHPRKERAEGGGAVLRWVGRTGGQDGSERGGGERRGHTGGRSERADGTGRRDGGGIGVGFIGRAQGFTAKVGVLCFWGQFHDEFAVSVPSFRFFF